MKRRRLDDVNRVESQSDCIRSAVSLGIVNDSSKDVNNSVRRLAIPKEVCRLSNCDISKKYFSRRNESMFVFPGRINILTEERSPFGKLINPHSTEPILIVPLEKSGWSMKFYGNTVYPSSSRYVWMKGTRSKRQRQWGCRDQVERVIIFGKVKYVDDNGEEHDRPPSSVVANDSGLSAFLGNEKDAVEKSQILEEMYPRSDDESPDGEEESILSISDEGDEQLKSEIDDTLEQDTFSDASFVPEKDEETVVGTTLSSQRSRRASTSGRKKYVFSSSDDDEDTESDEN